MSGISVALTVSVIYIHNHGSHTPIPRGIKRIMFGPIARAMCMSVVPDVALHGMTVVDEWTTSRENKSKLQDVYDPEIHAGDKFKCGIGPEWAQAVINTLHRITKKIEEKEKDDFIAEEWRILARILDRLFFWVTSLCFLLATSIIFFQGALHYSVHMHSVYEV